MKKRINRNTLCEGLYEYNRKQKKYRITDALRVLLLRDDFNFFLDQLKEVGLKKESVTNFKGEESDVYLINDDAGSIISEYVNEIASSDFFEDKTEAEKKNFTNVAYNLIKWTILDGFSNQKNPGLFHGITFVDPKHNYPNIHSHTYIAEIFWELLEQAFHNFEEIKKKYGKSPYDNSYGGSVNVTESKYHPRVAQIIFDHTTERHELIDYINDNWPSIELELRGIVGKKRGQRMTASATFLRDVEIFNKYQEFKDANRKNPDMCVKSWLKQEKKIDIDGMTIRKLVSDLNKDIKKINHN